MQFSGVRFFFLLNRPLMLMGLAIIFAVYTLSIGRIVNSDIFVSFYRRIFIFFTTTDEKKKKKPTRTEAVESECDSDG